METTMSTTASTHSEQQSVVFLLSNEFFGIDIFRVNEIIRLREITPIPRTESHLRGLVNLRGKTIPVVDLRMRLSLGQAEDTDTTRIIVVDSDSGNVGIVVDAVREVVSLAEGDIQDAPEMVTKLSTEFVRGVAQHAGGLITLLDLDKALAA